MAWQHLSAPQYFAAPWSQVLKDPPDEVCPAKTPTAMGSTRRYCSPSCLTRWAAVFNAEFAVLKMTELVWHGLCRVATEKQGHRGHAPQHIETGSNKVWASLWMRARRISAELPSNLIRAGTGARRCRRTPDQLGCRCHRTNTSTCNLSFGAAARQQVSDGK